MTTEMRWVTLKAFAVRGEVLSSSIRGSRKSNLANLSATTAPNLLHCYPHSMITKPPSKNFLGRSSVLTNNENNVQMFL